MSALHVSDVRFKARQSPTFVRNAGHTGCIRMASPLYGCADAASGVLVAEMYCCKLSIESGPNSSTLVPLGLHWKENWHRLHYEYPRPLLGPDSHRCLHLHYLSPKASRRQGVCISAAASPAVAQSSNGSCLDAVMKTTMRGRPECSYKSLHPMRRLQSALRLASI